MDHYICKGDCKNVSDNPGICEADFCNHKGEELEICGCENGTHEGKEKEEEAL